MYTSSVTQGRGHWCNTKMNGSIEGVERERRNIAMSVSDSWETLADSARWSMTRAGVRLNLTAGRAKKPTVFGA